MKCELTGELTVATAGQVKVQLMSALEDRCSFDLDTRGVSDVDTAGLQLLLAALSSAARNGIAVAYPSERHGAAVHDALRVVGLDSHDWQTKTAKG